MKSGRQTSGEIMFTNRRKFISGLFLLISLSTSADGYEILFQQEKLMLTLPLVDSQRQVVDKNAIIKLKVLDMNPTANSTVKFTLDEDYDFLQLDAVSGQLWFKQASWEQNEEAFYNPVITAERSDGATARMTLDLHVKPFEDVKDFCRDYMCFYESVTYRALEDFDDNYKMREIGELSPKIYKRFCGSFDVKHELLNASEFVNIKSNKLFTSASLNHETMSPGPELRVAVQCSFKSGTTTILESKVFNISIIDRNDNLIKVQDKVTNLTLSSPYFQQDALLNPHSFIVFKDDDTSNANFDIEFHLLNDDAHIFREACTMLQSNHTSMESTVFFCNLRFIISGHFTSSPYCVILQAREVIRGRTMLENATVCVFTNQTSTARGVEFLPQPEKLRDDRSKKIRKYTGNSATSSEMKVSSPTTNLVVQFPDEVVVLQNASEFARVVEPVEAVTDTRVNFKLLKDPLNIFNVTRVGGIVFIQDADALEKSLPASFNIEIGWGSQVKTILVRVAAANNSCNQQLEATSDFCSRYEFQDDCENACGFGSRNGRCKWRAMVASSPLSPTTSTYATCTPDIASCADKFCDPLEKLAKKQSPRVNLCPQDCTTDHVHGIIHNQKQGIGMVSREFVCTCDHDSQCSCAKPHRVPTTTAALPTEFISDMNNFSTGGLVGESMSSVRSANSECGRACMMITVGSPTFLVIIIIVLFTMRRRYVKKMKKRMMNGPMVHYRGSNDTEIIHINILNESRKENYQDTYQKFDFDAKWEFDRNKLILDTTLGEGEFGKVMKAYASDLNSHDTITTVAVKTVKSNNNSVELLALLSEFQLLQEVSHPNVIKLLGACIKGEPPMIIIEYCCFGSLRSYLRLSRKLEESGDLKIDGVEPVTATDVLSFAWQICKGMAYLAEMKLVHRDLAARNVLLAEGKVCKVSDFGLTRDVYEDDAYLKKSKDRVPVKWMSPESLADHVYTTKTDVWSFGIVGYELITLGATPYPGIPPQNLYHLLRSGYRMERPDNCSPEIYMLLEACWADDPLKRPSFKYLSSKFEKLLGRSAKYLDVDIDDGAISNPLYLANIDEISAMEEAEAAKKPTDDDDDSSRINELWTTPKFKTDVSKVDNKRYLLKYDDQLQLLLARYDQPKALGEARSISQKLRYQNDPNTFMPANSYVNSSQPDLVSLSDRERLIDQRYDTPRLKRNRSYVEMRNIIRCRKSSQSTTNDSFDDNNNEMPCNRTTINENLNFNDLDKLLNTDKEISFKFSSLNNLNRRLTTTETQC